MLRLSRVKALRSYLKQYDRILLGQSNACFYVGTYSTLLLNLFCLFYDDIDFLCAFGAQVELLCSLLSFQCRNQVIQIPASFCFASSRRR